MVIDVMRSYGFFNYVCLAACLIFLLGTAWQWRDFFVSAESNVEHSTVNFQAPVQPVVERRLDDSVARAVRSLEEKAGGETGRQGSASAAVKELSVAGGRLARLNLDVPFTSQAPEKNWDQPWQDACEEAAVLMLDAYYKGYGLSPLFARDEILKMVSWEEEQGWGYSIEMAKVERLFQKWWRGQSKIINHKSKIITNPTVQEIKQSIANGHPVLVVADGHALPNPYYRGDGPDYHALIIRGYTEDAFVTNDPGTWRGKNFVYKYEELMRAIHDWNNGEVKRGQPVALVASE